MQWQGPFKIVQKVAKHDYRLKVGDKEKTYHTNLLKKYVWREEDRLDVVSVANHLSFVCAGIVEAADDHFDDDTPALELPPLEQTEFPTDVCIDDKRSESETLPVWDLVHEYSDVFTDMPGKTHLVEYTVKLPTDEPIRSKPYPVAYAVQGTIKREVEMMTRLGVIEPSTSSYAAPIVLVRKKDGTNRFCIDFRKLNKVTLFDPEPIPNTEDLMAKLGKGK